MTNTELDIAESISYVLLNESRINDANRFLSCIRKPSKLTLDIMQDISDICDRRKR